MNAAEQLQDYIRTAHPGASVILTPPLSHLGVWFIDLACGDKRLTVEWSATGGFGVSSSSEDSYGERPDEAIESLDEVQRRITELLTTAERTTPRLGVLVSRLRELRRLTQAELAGRLGVRQPTVSGIERRSDIQLSTLHRVIDALEGTFEVFVVFSGRRYRLFPGSVEPLAKTEPPKEYQGCDAVGEVDGAPDKRDDNVTFRALSQSGELPRARRERDNISYRGMVWEMVD